MSLLRSFLAIQRWQALREAMRAQGQRTAEPSLSWPRVGATLLLCLFAPTGIWLAAVYTDIPVYFPSTILAASTILAILLRPHLHLCLSPPKNWRTALSLTHTAVALGCIPAILIVLLFPEHLPTKHTVLVQAAPSLVRDSPDFAWLQAMLTIPLIALWASATEEILFRGLLLSALRRLPVPSRQNRKDCLAVLLSAVLFGVAHLPTWGVTACIALVGLGGGFGFAYIASGERLYPVIVYHFFFDLLSIMVAIFLF